MDKFDARMKTPFACLISGSSLSGKTTFVKRLLQHRDKLIDNEFDYLLWCYGQKTHFVEKLRNQCFGLQTVVHAGIPDSFDTYIQPGKRGLIVLDDLMQKASNSEQVATLFCNKVQHENVSVILLMQNLFYQGKERMTLLRCSHYLVIFKSPLDATIPYHLAGRILPSKRKDFLDLFEYATRDSYGYLFIDGHQTTPPAARFRTKIFDKDVQHVMVLSSDSRGDDTRNNYATNKVERK